jgi:hypothetical protein
VHACYATQAELIVLRAGSAEHVTDCVHILKLGLQHAFHRLGIDHVNEPITLAKN